jgi:primary-amine oxidase
MCFDTSDTKNFWGRPIENVVSVVDLNEKKLFKLEDGEIVPVPRPQVDYDEKATGAPRERKPLVTGYTQGNGFTLEGSGVTWQRWRFHVRTDPRAGLVLSLVRYQDGERLRSVLYEGSLSEIFVPYSDPTSGWYFRTYLDAGEYGVGKLAVPLVEGADCPPNAAYLSDVLADDHGKPQVRERVACIFEREAGDIAWRHYEFVNENTESRRARDLVVRQIAAIGNYDYVFDWTFREDGTIKVSVGATGIAEVKGVKPKNATDEGGANAAAYGRYVDDHLVATNHDHFLSFRLDLDVDGTKNSFVKDELRAHAPREGLRKSIWTTEVKTVKRENEARLHMNMAQPALWRVINPSALSARGYPVSYQLMPGHNVMSILSPEDFPTKRAGFTNYMLWVTPYAPNERWAAGDYPNRSRGGEGLPQWTKANRAIENTDVVLWYTIGFHHIVRPEDWPVMPTSVHEFELRAFGFFDRNPALDLPK